MSEPLTETAALSAWSNAVAALVQRAGASVVAVQTGRHEVAAGVLWRTGCLVTVAHPLRRTQGIPVVLPDRRRVSAELAGHDGATDLAVLRLGEEAAALQPIESSDATRIQAGHWVIAVARSLEGDLSASQGIVARASGAWRSWRGGHLDRLIRLDGGLYGGFSGAAVLDAGGQAIGIATSALSRSAGIVIPGATVQRVADELLAKGRVARGYLGVEAQPVSLPSHVAQAQQLDDPQGLLVTSVAEDSPAAQAGMLIGDVLLEVASQRTRDIDDLHSTLYGDRVGQRVAAVVLRGGQRRELAVTVGERPRAHC
jgi:S1-C subfamily serine protease